MSSHRFVCSLHLAALLALLALVLGAGGLGCGTNDDPLIEAMVPARAPIGAPVDIVGERFVGEPRFVSFGGISAPVTFWQDLRVRVEVPDVVVGTVPVVVSVGGRPSPPFDFQVDPR